MTKIVPLVRPDDLEERARAAMPELFETLEQARADIRKACFMDAHLGDPNHRYLNEAELRRSLPVIYEQAKAIQDRCMEILLDWMASQTPTGVFIPDEDFISSPDQTK